MPKGKSDSVPAKMQAVYDEIIALTDAVCRQHLDEEYAQLARLMTAALARKRPSPLDREERTSGRHQLSTAWAQSISSSTNPRFHTWVRKSWSTALE